MKKLINENECSKNEYAYLTDRVMINKGKAQIYGTQVEVNKEGTEYVPKKLYNPKHVDKRRKKMEIIPNSLQDYLNNMKRDFLKNESQHLTAAKTYAGRSTSICNKCRFAKDIHFALQMRRNILSLLLIFG